MEMTSFNISFHILFELTVWNHLTLTRVSKTSKRSKWPELTYHASSQIEMKDNKPQGVVLFVSLPQVLHTCLLLWPLLVPPGVLLLPFSTRILRIGSCLRKVLRSLNDFPFRWLKTSQVIPRDTFAIDLETRHRKKSSRGYWDCE